MPKGQFAALLLRGIAVVAIAANSPIAAAQANATFEFQLPAQSLSLSLRAVAALSKSNIVAPSDLVDARPAPALVGTFTAGEAVALLLKGSGLHSVRVGSTMVIRAGAISEAVSPDSANSVEADVVVTGSRIRGAPIASPVITLTQESARNAGQATLAEMVRSLPQSFGGGQNPGVGNNVPAGNGVNVGGSTSINLRGLGSDATLTLLNGHRLSYSASRQAIDVSAIPLGAVERIEIVPDGASALYGSDAVAGVANIILKRDFDGFEADARVGGATDGGDFEQRYGVVAGRKWNTGGIIGSYEHAHTSQILGSQRSYTDDRPGLSLFPSFKTDSALVSAHQEIVEGVTFDVDTLYNDRVSDSAYALNPAGDIKASGARFAYNEKAFAIAPTLRAALGAGWSAFLTGSYGQDHTHYDVSIYSAGNTTLVPNNCYCNDAKAIELGADGALLQLPAGALKIAIGTGYRTNTLVRFNGVGAATNVDRSQDSYYAYGEISLPIVSSTQQVAWIDRLSLSAALRYEKYPGIGEIVTPKGGVIFAPTPDFDLKGSWGKSFRAPTLYQQYAARNVVLVTPDAFGGSGYAPNATAILAQGGNPDLKPERATTWTATVEFQPRALPGFHGELGYFSTHYRDRIVTPIAFLSQALSNPLYKAQVTPNPSQAFLASLVASAASFGNGAGVPYDPANVAVFVDDTNLNAGRQTIHGVDALLSYTTALANSDRLTTTLNATYLDSDQQLAPGQPVTQLAGVIFNPAHFRARAGVNFEHRALSIESDLNYIGGVSDTRLAPAHVGSMTTLDLSARFRSSAASGLLRGIDLVASVQNLTNTKPAKIAVTSFFDAPYDSTNYSPVGRFVSFSIHKVW